MKITFDLEEMTDTQVYHLISSLAQGNSLDKARQVYIWLLAKLVSPFTANTVRKSVAKSTADTLYLHVAKQSHSYDPAFLHSRVGFITARALEEVNKSSMELKIVPHIKTSTTFSLGEFRTPDALSLIAVFTESYEDGIVGRLYGLLSFFELRGSKDDLPELVNNDLSEKDKKLLKNLDMKMRAALKRIFPEKKESVILLVMNFLYEGRRRYINNLYDTVGLSPNIYWKEIEENVTS